MRKLIKLSEIYQDYETFVIDLWGVINDGVRINLGALNVVENLQKKEKKIIFLSNAPRPKENVIEFLLKIKLQKKYLKNVMTSGEAAINSIKSSKFGKKFYHLGPNRDNSLFKGLEKNKTNIEDCDYILCTGLFDDKMNDINFYKEFLKKYTNKILVCTNPDLIVHRGDAVEFCAGKLASIFEKIGGRTVYFGKPHKEIYNLILNKKEKALLIGDNLNTDIKGANNIGKDSVFIYNGIHKSEITNENDILNISKKYKTDIKFYQKELCW